MEVDGSIVDFFELTKGVEGQFKKDFDEITDEQIASWMQDNNFVGVRYPEDSGYGVRIIDPSKVKIKR